MSVVYEAIRLVILLSEKFIVAIYQILIYIDTGAQNIEILHYSGYLHFVTSFHIELITCKNSLIKLSRLYTMVFDGMHCT